MPPITGILNYQNTLMNRRNLVLFCLFILLSFLVLLFPFAYDRFFRDPQALAMEHLNSGKTYFDQKKSVISG